MLRALFCLSLVVQANAQSAVAFTNVTVVDVETGTLIPNQTVLVEGLKIATVDKAARVRIPRGAQVIAGQGKFLIPGLWDMHVHEFTSPHVPELFLANGITGIRDMYDVAPRIRELRKEVQEHRRDGPRV